MPYTTKQCENYSARALDIRMWWTNKNINYATSLEKIIELECPEVWVQHQEKLNALEIPWEASVFKVIGNTVEYFRAEE